MSMHVAGAIRPVTVLENGAQIHQPDGAPFSFPVTWGEAGIYADAHGPYITG